MRRYHVTNGDQYHFKLSDNSATPKWTISTEETNPGGDQSSAEAITEDSDGRHVQIPLTNFGTVTFSHVAANSNNLAYYNQITQIPLSGGRVSVSELGATQFSVTYKHG
jgi:hypothetical protein